MDESRRDNAQPYGRGRRVTPSTFLCGPDHSSDFETNWLLDRNLQVGLALADSHYGAHPPLKKDKFWAKPIAEPLYTPESASLHRNPQIGSCADIS